MARPCFARLVCLTLLVTAGCDDDNSDRGMTPTAPAGVAPRGTITVLQPATVTAGSPFVTTIFGSDPVCILGNGFAGPCRRVRIVAPTRGLLRIVVSNEVDDGNGRVGMILVNQPICCGFPTIHTMRVAAGSTHEFAIVLLDARGGRAPDAAFARVRMTTTVE